METIYTKNAPEAIGPYSQGKKVGEFIFTSGQIPVVPTTGEVVDGGILEQTHQVLKNLQAVLLEGGGGLDTVVKTTCFITDMNNFAVFNKVYEEYFTINKPARSCVAVKELPKGVLCEIEAIAMSK